MRTIWYSHLKTKAEQEEFKKIVLGSQKVLDKLREIVYNDINTRELTSITEYDSPSWAYLQADKNGELRALKRMLDILKLNPDQEE